MLSPRSTASITGAHVDWADSKGLNQWEPKALELADERSKLGYGISYVETSSSRIAGPSCLEVAKGRC